MWALPTSQKIVVIRPDMQWSHFDEQVGITKIVNSSLKVGVHMQKI